MSESQNEIAILKSKIFGGEKEYDLIDVYHYLMVHYGYIPFEEFKKMDASLVNELVHRINKMNEKMGASSKGRLGRRMG